MAGGGIQNPEISKQHSTSQLLVPTAQRTLMADLRADFNIFSPSIWGNHLTTTLLATLR
jgi:hypothetical protein